MIGKLYIVGEHIHAGSSCVCSLVDGKLYPAGETAGEYIGDAVEELREGFRASAAGVEVREDDA